jgi:high-affinity iron transporter
MSWLVQPGTIGSSLLTGVLGLQPRPTVGETFGWLIYAVPTLAYVLWPRTARITPKVAVLSLVLLPVAALFAVPRGPFEGESLGAVLFP